MIGKDYTTAEERLSKLNKLEKYAIPFTITFLLVGIMTTLVLYVVAVNSITAI